MTTLLLAIALALALPCGADVAVTAYAVAVENPEAILNASLERTDAALVVRFQAPTEGTYRIGLRVESAEITPLSPGTPVFTPADEPTALRHPYDWTYVGARNVLSVRPRLVMPGVAVGERVYLIDTRELTAVHLEPVGGDAVAALLLAHRYYNDGADAATPDLHLVAGELVELTIRVFDTLTDAKLARYGVRPAMTGRMCQVAYRGWTATQFGPDAYRRVADRLAGAYDQVLVREAGTHDWIAPIFHERGLRVYAYQYTGALRRYSVQAPEERETELAMTGSGGERYTAPRSPDGAWLLLDVRRPEMRELCVARAVAAIEAGFDGIFLDGPTFFPDAQGRRGGNVPDSTHSLAWGQALLLEEITRAVHAANPEAVVGALGNHYFDHLGAVDFVVKERMYFAWDEFAKDFRERRTWVSAELDLPWEEGLAPLVGTNLCYGVKGISPVAVQSAAHFIRRPTGLMYLGTGDFLPDELDAWLDTVVALATEDELYVTAIEPADRRLHFAGRDRLRVDEDCTITLSRPACLLDEAGECLAHQVKTVTLLAHTRYRLVTKCR